MKEQTSKYGQIVVGVVVPVGVRWETVLNIKQLIGSGKNGEKSSFGGHDLSLIVIIVLYASSYL